MENISQILEEVKKALTTAPASGGMMTRENLSDFVVKLPYRDTPIRDRLTRKKGNGVAAAWNVLTTIGAGNSAFAEGGTPTEDAGSYVRRSAIYKELGKTKSITDRMIAA
jgi:hypothetical protein